MENLSVSLLKKPKRVIWVNDAEKMLCSDVEIWMAWKVFFPPKSQTPFSVFNTGNTTSVTNTELSFSLIWLHHVAFESHVKLSPVFKILVSSKHIITQDRFHIYL